MGAGPQAERVGQRTQPDPLLTKGPHHGPGIHGAAIATVQGEAHQPGRGRHRQKAAGGGQGLQTLPEPLAARADRRQPGRGVALSLQQLQRCVQARQQRCARGGHFEAASITVVRAAAAVLIPQRAPADQRGPGLLQQPLGERHGPQAFGPAAPLMAGDGINVGRAGGARHRQAAEGLGRIHQQPGMARMVRQTLGHRLDRQHATRVPEEMGQHHQPGAGAQHPLQGLQSARPNLGGIARQIAHGQGGDR